MPRKLYLVSYDVHSDNEARERVRNHLENEHFREALESVYVGHSEKEPKVLLAAISAEGKPGRVDVLLTEIATDYAGTAAPMAVMAELPTYRYDRPKPG